MNDTKVKLMTVADLRDESAQFYIDAFQRGYRWTANEVRDLLDDIREFNRKIAKQDNDEFYCLQPIIVTKSEDGISWKVIDGQQRLTTLYLVYSYYWVESSPSRRIMPFKLSYNNKLRLEECLQFFTSNSISTAAGVGQEMEEFENDIDCHYVMEAYKCICDFFQKLSGDLHTEEEIDGMKKIFNTRMKIIWYEIKDCDLDKEIAVFTKINMGKIPLKNAELIKALLLERDGKDPAKLSAVQTDIAVKWNEIESQLSEEDFWGFLVNEKKAESSYIPKIDFIFHVMARKLNSDLLPRANNDYPNDEPYSVSESANKDKFSFYVFSNYVRLFKDHPEYIQSDDKHYIQIIWDEVCEYYRMFKDWYRNNNWYHMIGFLVEVSEKDNVDIILKLSQIYMQGSEKDGKGHKDFFENKLRQEIAHEVFGKQDIGNDECRDYISDLKYGTKPEDIRSVLLLYNIAYLFKCDMNSRFPFEKYKDKSTSWDLEHINAVADIRPEDDRRRSEENVRLIWLKNAEDAPDIDQITTPDGRPVKEQIKKIIQEESFLSTSEQGDEEFIRIYDAVVTYFGGTEPDHSIRNLTLLDSSTNRSYKNSVFPVKRKTILERSMNGVFIPLCTWKVFMKGFLESRDLLKWSAKDKEAYEKEIIDSICEYLRLEDIAHE